MWSKVLRAKKMMGYQFNRQFPLNINGKHIIVDFICRKLNLIIEVDGYSHNFKYEEDKERDKSLIESNYKVLRIRERDVKYDLFNVTRMIELTVIELEKSIPQAPFSKGD